MTIWDRLKLIGTALRPNRFGADAAYRSDGSSVRDRPDFLFGLGNTYDQGDKIVVTESTALSISPVWSAVRVISGAISILPLKIYKWDRNNSRDEANDWESSKRLASRPNYEQIAPTFWETIIAHVLLWGNGYAEIERNLAGDPVNLWIIPPTFIEPMRSSDGELYYEIAYESASQATLEPENVLHIPGLGWDGTKGYSVVSMARRSLELTAGYETAAISFAENGMRPSGALKYPGSLEQLQKRDKTEEVKKNHAGVKSFGKMMLLYGGMEWQQFGIPQGDAQFLETRRFQVDEVCRWFNVPQHMLREMERSTNNNIEHMAQEFVTQTLMYWLTKIEQEFTKKVIGSKRLYAEFLTDAIIRGDIKSRYDAYSQAIQFGFMTPNEARRKENLPPMEGGDKLFIPANLRPVDLPYEMPSQNSANNGIPAQGGANNGL